MAESRQTSSSSASVEEKVSANVPKTQATSSENSDPIELMEITDTAAPQTILDEASGYEHTAYNFSNTKKWWVLTVVALCQTSMNFNAAVYSNTVHPLNEQYNTTKARDGMAGFLITYAFGCEIWAPWSEELGRWPIMQLSLLLINAWQPLAGASNAWWQVLFARIMGGFCTAGGSVTLGMVADMFEPEEQQYAVLWASLWSCLGSVIGGICGGPIEQFLHWRWNFWIQLIFGGVVQIIHFFFVPETRATVMLDKAAKRMRKRDSSCKVYGPNESKSLRQRFELKEIMETMWRPFHMLIFEPVVLFLSLLSGFSDALIFSFLESYGIVFSQWGFQPAQHSLAMLALFLGYWLAALAFVPIIHRHNKRRANHETLSAESRLMGLLWLVPLLPIGLLGSAFTVTGPPLPWIAPLVFAVLIGGANLAIYYATIDYMVAAYGGKFAASATGGNGFSRDFLAGLCAFYTGPMYRKLNPQNATFLLFAISFLVCIPVYVFYFKGPQIMARSPWAEKIQEEKQRMDELKERAHERRQVLENGA